MEQIHTMMSTIPALQPFDKHNQALERNVRPTPWTPPRPAARYNLVVIGAGTAGLVTAAGAAGLGAKVALVERGLMGGDCLNVGCVPSKGMIRAARAAAAVRAAEAFGVRVPAGATVDFSAVMDRMRRLRAGISQHDSVARFQGLGVDVFLGQACFTHSDTVDVDGTKLKFRRAVIATGARAAELPIPGLSTAGVLTNETIFSLTQLPRRLAVIGAGPMGSEMAQVFARFGAQVTLIEKTSHLLSREDEAAAQIVQSAICRDGVNVRLNTETVELAVEGLEKLIYVKSTHATDEIRADQVLVGVGRQPNVEGLQLERVGVDYDPRRGVIVDDRLRTTNRRIYAAGDICSPFRFTHAADFMARIVIQNALFLGRRKASALTIPWATYTSPELAHVGLTEKEANAKGLEIDTYTQEFSGVDRAILDGETDGFVKISVRRGSDKIVGATIVAENAGDMVGSLSIAMTHGIGLGRLANSIHPYPTQAEAIRKVGDLYRRSRLTPFVKSLLARWLDWTR